MKPNPIEQYQSKARAMLDGWSMEMSRLRANALLLEPEQRSEAIRQLARLEALYNEAFQQYVVMQVNLNGRPEDLRQAFDAAAEQVCQAIDEMAAQIA